MEPQLDMVGSNVAWAKHTIVHPAALLILVALGVVMLTVRRQYAIWPVILLCCFITSAQRVVVGGADFSFLRLMVLIGWIRVFSRGEHVGLKWNTLDALVVGWAAADTVMHTLLFGDFSALVNRLGNSYDSVGLYFLFRCLLHSWEDVSRTVVGFVVASVPVMGFFLLEHFTGRNVFGAFGAVPLVTIVREGRLRCQGAFSHPILAGCFWASMTPLMAALWFRGGLWRIATAVGLTCSLVIILLCASSTPVVAVGFGILGACCFTIRYYMRSVRWMVLLLAIALHMSMQAPVWHLVSRIDLSGGSTGWQRFYLVDQTIRRVGEWALMGVRSTAPWGDGLIDITNQFVLQAISGGMLTLVLYVAMITIAFRQTGRLWREERGLRWHMMIAWSLGVTLFVHVSNFMAVSYFGQIEMVWYLCLAMVGSIAARTGIQPAVAPAVRRLVAAPAQAPTAPRRRRRPRTESARRHAGASHDYSANAGPRTMSTISTSAAPVMDVDAFRSEGLIVVTTREALAAACSRWLRIAAACGAFAPEPFVDLFMATLKVTGDDVQPYIVLLDSEDGGRGMIVGRRVTRSVACKIGYFHVRTPRLRCLEITDGGLLTDQSPAARQALARHLSGLLASGEVEHLLIGHLPVAHDLFADLSRRFQAGAREVHWTLNLVPGSYEETMKGYSSKHRWTLRKKDKVLVEHFGGKVSFDQLTRPDQLDELIRAASGIVAHSYQGALGVSVEDNDWWRAILGVEAEHGRMRGYLLTCDGRPIAFQAGANWNGTYKLMATSFLPEFRDLSPGIVLHMRVLQALCAEGATRVDYGFGDADYKKTYGSESVEEQSLRIYGRSARAILASMLDRCCTIITRTTKRAAASLGLLQWLKRTWRARLQKPAE